MRSDKFVKEFKNSNKILGGMHLTKDWVKVPVDLPLASFPLVVALKAQINIAKVAIVVDPMLPWAMPIETTWISPTEIACWILFEPIQVRDYSMKDWLRGIGRP